MTAQSDAHLSYSANARTYSGQMTGPGENPRAGVVLLPDWRGQSALARDHAGFLARLACRVVIADLYGDGFSPQNPDDVGPMVRRLVESRHEGVAALAACVDAFRRTLPP